MTNIKPIETRYAGHRFRSRLEARWAVLFDHLGIRWEYEPQGYVVGATPGIPYLPDFWLPDPGIWVEVKGSEDQLDVQMLVDAAIPHHGLPAGHWVGDYHVRILILGPIGQVKPIVDRATQEDMGDLQPAHAVLSFRKGDLFQGSAQFAADGLMIYPDGGLVANDGVEIFWDTRRTEWGNWVVGSGGVGAKCDDRVIAAYRAARSARFEHGES